MKTIYITEAQKNEIKRSLMLEESLLCELSNRQNEREIANAIASYSPPYIRQYLETPLNQCPPQIQEMCRQLNRLYQSVCNNTSGKNRFIDYLRLNLCSQFGITRGNGASFYTAGIALISCRDLGFYSFDPNIMQGGKIIKLGKLCKLIDKHPEIMEGVQMDEYFNHMTYDELMRIFEPKIAQYAKNAHDELNSFTEDVPHRYEIRAINDTISGNGAAIPTANDRRFLNQLGQYTDWCICGADGNSEYAQYVSNGGKFYILMRDDYKNIERKEGDNCPLDDYGLSLIAVIVGSDGLPDNITTRWNHENNGENPDGLWNAKQLQTLTHIRYKSVFKPRGEDELRRMNISESTVPAAQDQVHNKVNSGIMDAVTMGGTMEEGAEPESDEYSMGFENDSNLEYGHINESIDYNKSDYKKDMIAIAKFMKSEGLNVYPFPKIKLKWDEQDGLFIKTGYYEPETKTVVVFCKDRHPKDILRSFAHEMIHHSQNLDGKDLNFTSDDDVKDNDRLEKIEGEAYLQGNIYFRKWTEHKRKKETLQESVSHIEESIEPSDVSLKSFDIKKNLNPKFWKDDKLDSRIRMRLLDIADDFIEFLGVDWVKPEDVIMTGSLANYNWDKKYSDIDLHILMDYSKVDKRKDFVSNYFYSQKKLWNDEHQDLKIFGFPIEVYVQDVNEKHNSTGVYSLDKNEWILEPEREKLTKQKINKEHIKKIVSNYANKIDDLVDTYNKSKGDEYKVRVTSEKAEKLFDSIKKERTKGLNKTNNEISDGNIIFKCLRRMGYIEKLVNLKASTYDKMNSIS